jgi:PST family polysaccharide transporter
LVNFLQGISGVIAACICFWVIFKKFKHRFIAISLKDIRHEITDGWMLFLSSLAVNIYVNSNAFILGFYVGAAQLGIYSICEKVYLALKQFDNVFSQVIYPKVCVLAKESMQALKNFYIKIFLPYLICITLACITVAGFAKYICFYFLKNENPQVIFLLRLFCIVPVINAFNTPPFQTLLALNEKKKYGFVLIAGCIFNIILNIILDKIFGATGATVTVMLTELFITGGLSVYFLNIVNQNPVSLDQGY